MIAAGETGGTGERERVGWWVVGEGGGGGGETDSRVRVMRAAACTASSLSSSSSSAAARINVESKLVLRLVVISPLTL